MGEKNTNDRSNGNKDECKGRRTRMRRKQSGTRRRQLVGQGLDEDPRLKVMKREWFEGKDCLDIGCNSGLMTIAIAKKFGCRSILGVDIDGARIEDAYWTLRKVIRTSKHRVTSTISRSADGASVSGLVNNASESLTEEKQNSSGDSPFPMEKDLLEIVSFQKGNFVQNWRPPENTSYHAILCLSVTKWIHLNWGDDGLITLFWRVWKLLQPGGIFIVEPQPWSSYYNNRFVSETAAANYKNIQIPPEDFQDVLLDKSFEIETYGDAILYEVVISMKFCKWAIYSIFLMGLDFGKQFP
ncbi:UNVERIFIED_CONTAM: putative RNA methyltransferase [Sesamum latifolium]|uniref:RNA methyltransferase n=1 Tax=Sesamum latifolium TaxID=2727402 RepID=A0AAW2U1R3_9LAMI